MVIHNYICRQCGKFLEDVEWAHHADVQRFIPCDCGNNLEIHYGSCRGIVHFNPNNSALGYGKPWLSLGGIVVKDYAHKKRILRERGLEEANDSNRGERGIPYPKGYNPDTGEAEPDALPADLSGLEDYTLAAESMEDLNAQMQDMTEHINADLQEGKTFWDEKLESAIVNGNVSGEHPDGGRSR